MWLKLETYVFIEEMIRIKDHMYILGTIFSLVCKFQIVVTLLDNFFGWG